MAKEKYQELPKGGCFSRLMGLFVFLVIIGLGVGLYFISLPQDLSDLTSNREAMRAAVSPPRDMQTVLQKSIEGNYSVTLSEKEINQWLAKELKLKQGGFLGKWVELKSVMVRLREDVAEVIVERDIQGHVLTTSMFLQVEQVENASGIRTQIHLHGGGIHEAVPFPKRGGRFGKLAVPQGFLILVMPDFRKLAYQFEDEIDLGFQRMARIKIKHKQLELDPKQPTRNADDEDAF